MATTLKELMQKIRINTHDNDSLEYTDVTLINYINDGIRFIRRIILDLDPMLIAEYTTGNTGITTETESVNEDGETVTTTTISDFYVIDLGQKVSAVIDVRIGGKLISAVNPRLIPDETEIGDPAGYHVVGFRKIMLYPRPSNSLPYSAFTVPDITLLKTEDDEFPLMSEFEDFVIEYAGIRCSVSNEFDVSQETNIMGSIISQVEAIVRSYNCRGLQSAGYWDGMGTRVRDYGRRYW